MKKIFLTALILATASNGFAGGLNSVCTILDSSLPGKAAIMYTIINANQSSMKFKVVISKQMNSFYDLKFKEGTKREFLLANKGTGEASTCTISFLDGMTLDLVDMDLDLGKFVFEDKSTRLTIFK